MYVKKNLCGGGGQSYKTGLDYYLRKTDLKYNQTLKKQTGDCFNASLFLFHILYNISASITNSSYF